MTSVVGRKGELDAIDGFLESIETGRAPVMLLSGMAGIGKTTLWNAGVGSARDRRYRVVTARPTEVETGLAFASLGDQVLRRSRQKGASREAFGSALELFTRLGARLWIERTQAELGRVAMRRPAGSPLTETERRVAELAGAGQTNREIADALFISVHTVEAHLTRVYRTLGVQSRTELARVDLDKASGG